MSDNKAKELYEKDLDDLLEQENEERDRLRELYQTDLIGVLSELHSYVGLEEIHRSREEERIEEELQAFMQHESEKRPCDTPNNPVMRLFNSYGIAAEESGFRRGFQTAMRLCAEVLRGGVAA